MIHNAPPTTELVRIQALNDLSREIKTSGTFEEKIRSIATKAKELAGADLAVVCLADKTGNRHYTGAVSGEVSPDQRDLDFLIEDNPHLISIRESETTCARMDVTVQDPHMPVLSEQFDKMGIRCCLVVPLQGHDRHLGFLFVGNRNAVDVTRTGQCLLSLMGNLLAAEIDRQRSEVDSERLVTVLEQAAETIIITNKEGVIQYVNPSFEVVSGYTREEAVGKHPKFLQSGRQNADFYRDMWKTLRAGDIWRGHLVNRRKNGSFYKLDATISPIKNEKGEVTDYVSVRKDVTQETLLRKQLYQAQKMEAIGTLAGGIAHDFNNLLMGIQGCASLLRMDIPEDSTVQKRCRIIEKHIMKGADLTRQLLGIGKRGKYQQVPTDITKLVKANLEMFGRTKKEIRIQMEPGSTPCISEVDPGQIDQVFLNLFVNAWQAMPGGGCLNVKTEQMLVNGKRPKIANLKPGTYVKVTVGDTGIGINGAIIDKIFDPFFTTKEKERGTGLGLASAYGIVKNHGGIIHVNSEVNRGTSFEIFLPASGKASVNKSSRTDQIARGKETVLIVDDEATILDICGEMLKKLGYNVLTASNGEEAVSRFETEKEKIDLVILDLVMPGLSGEKVYEHLVGFKKDVKVLLASGYTLEKQARRLLSRNATGFIQKPYSVSSLSQKVREIIG